MENMVNASFWSNKTVLITGHTGFKGSWLALWLQLMGAKVIGYSLSVPTDPSLFEVARVAENMVSIEGDVRDFQKFSEVIKIYSPDILIHMAAQSLVRPSYQDPLETFSTNIMGTASVLEAVRKTQSVKVVINVTSDKCYENREWVWGYRETDPMGGYDPYSSSKGCSELITSSYRHSFFNPERYDFHGVGLASVRAGNVVGGGDWAKDRLIPDIMRSIMDHSVVTIRNPTATRPWQHVLVPLSGYLLLAEKMWVKGAVLSDSWNFGPMDDDAKPVQWIVDYLSKNHNDIAWDIDNDNTNPHEAQYLKLDCSKAKRVLDWTPKWDIRETLNQILLWYSAYEAKQDMKEITLGQIRNYMNND